MVLRLSRAQKIERMAAEKRSKEKELTDRLAMLAEEIKGELKTAEVDLEKRQVIRRLNKIADETIALLKPKGRK